MRHIPVEWLGEVLLVLAVLGGGGSIGVAVCRLAVVACSSLASRAAGVLRRRREDGRAARQPQSALALAEASLRGC